MTATTSLGIVYPFGTEPICKDADDPTGIRTPLRRMADTIEPLFAGWVPVAAAALERPRVQVRASDFTVVSATSWQIPYDTLVFNDGTATDLGLLPGLTLGPGIWRLECVINVPGGAPSTPGPWGGSCIGLENSDLFDYGTGTQNTITLAGLASVSSLATLQVTATAFPPIGGSALVAYSTLTAIRINS